jgi:hypothetical protein
MSTNLMKLENLFSISQVNMQSDGWTDSSCQVVACRWVDIQTQDEVNRCILQYFVAGIPK